MAHIQILLLTFIYNYMRPLIDNGMVYMALPPLYKATYRGKVTYLIDDEALALYKAKHPASSISRFKGLGEMDPIDLRDTTISAKSRVLQRVTIEDAKATSKLIDDLMGTNVAPRKAFIFKHAGEIVVDN